MERQWGTASGKQARDTEIAYDVDVLKKKKPSIESYQNNNKDVCLSLSKDQGLSEVVVFASQVLRYLVW